MCIRSTHCFITSTGHGEPAMTPVRSVRQVELVEVGVAELGDEHRRHAVERGAALGLDRLEHGAGSNASAGMTIVAPWVVQPRLPITMPKQW